jgi:predicted nucleic acid-binding protein
MITAIDTNVLLDILIPNELFFEASLACLEDAGLTGSLVICDLVYAELCLHFTAQDECDRFLEENQIRVEPLTREAHFLAGRIWRAYRQQGGKQTRILADFFIAAHAQLQASQLLTRDRGFYGRQFPKLNVVEPAVRKPHRH